MNGKNIKQEIFSAVSLCGYPPNVIDSLIELITQIMNYPYVKSTPQYKIKTINQEKIIAVRCPLEIPFNKKVYEIPIVIFFSKFIPLEPPKILLEVSKGTAINPKAKDVDISSRKIVTPSLLSWNQSSNIIAILNEIKASFSKVFPIYKVKKSLLKDDCDSRPTLNTINNNMNDRIHTNININNNAIFNFVNNNNNNNNYTTPNNDPFANIASIFTENFLNNKTNTGFNITYNNNGIQNINNNDNFTNIKTQNNQNMNNNNNINNYNTNNYNNYMNLKMFNNQNINNMNRPSLNNNNLNPFNVNQLYEKDNIIKDILIESVFDKISSKLISEYKKLNQQNKTLNNYKNQYKNESEKIEKYVAKKQEISNECTKHLYYLNNEIKKCKDYINKKKENKITDQNCLDFVKVENPRALQAIAQEINNEELIIMIKKGFEKKKITLQEAISSTRDAARELFISKYIREKGLKNIGKY